MFSHLKVGDSVTRMLGGEIPMEMTVRDVGPKLLRCTAGDRLAAGAIWTFSRSTGAEIDKEMGWDETKTGSVLRRPSDEKK